MLLLRQLNPGDDVRLTARYPRLVVHRVGGYPASTAGPLGTHIHTAAAAADRSRRMDPVTTGMTPLEQQRSAAATTPERAVVRVDKRHRAGWQDMPWRRTSCHGSAHARFAGQ